ncbi:hypothetical protein NliqN6_2284 [Naganishia liquefaciens]|uniref:Uncharacterized protein n=1 Tax=Naganishia liquefaciens TaxID=104408 RepID=A0A8H3TRJ3_9TREE|nr:hypothetical protein NliqN6_2284 [Naganishia liquefaciens]
MAAPRIAITTPTRWAYRSNLLIAGQRCRSRSTDVRRSILGPRPRGYAQVGLGSTLSKKGAYDRAKTYADTLSAEFSAKRHVDHAVLLRGLRAQEQEILTTARSLGARDPLDTLNGLTHRTLDVLDDLPSNAQTQQIRATIIRCTIRTFTRHPLGIPFARQLVARTDTIDEDTLGTLIRRFRYAQENNQPWALPGESSSHRTVFYDFLTQTLTRLRKLAPDIFSQIMDIHIDNGMSVDALTTLINQCMAFSHQWNGRWTPAAWQVIIQAYRRDGDVAGCIRTYQAFRESRGGDEAWERYISSTAAWPYEALLAACTDRSGIVKGRYRAPADMPEVIWRDMQHDGVPPPPRLIAHLLKLARENADVEAGLRLWDASPNVDIDCYTQYLGLIREHSPSTPLRPLIRRILEDKITARQTVPRVRALWSQALFTALSPPYHDFPLARFLLERFDPDEATIDHTASRLLGYGNARSRGAAWWRSVWNTEPPSQKRHAPRGIQSRNARARGMTRAGWEIVSRRLRELGAGDVALPLSRPVARWERSHDMYGIKVSRGTVDFEPVKRALLTVMERCIMARPKVGTIYPGATPTAALRAAIEGVYRDLFGA